MAVLELGVDDARLASDVTPVLVSVDGDPRLALRRLWAIRLALDFAAITVAALAAGAGWWMAAYGVLVAIGLTARGGYRHPLTPSALEEVPTVGTVCGVALLPLGLAALLWSVPGQPILQATLTLAGITAGRGVAYAAVRRARLRAQLREPALIVGAGRVGVELYRALRDHPEYGLEPLGLVDDVPRRDRITGSIPLLGSLAELAPIARRTAARHILVAFGPTAERESVTALRVALGLDVDAYVVPRYFELGVAGTGPAIEDVWGIPLWRLHRAAAHRVGWRVKRAVDVVVAGIALAAAMLLLAALGLVVRMSSPGPVLYRQRRIGQHGRPFDLLKFRTMTVNDDNLWTIDLRDPRVTPAGQWMRRLSLDELPQLWNVFRGDMSLIGPRPERPQYAERYARDVAGYDDRHRLPVGLTGLAQVNGLRGDTSIEHRARFDNAYIEGWSLWTDMKIAARTAGEVVRHARRSG